MLTCDASIIVAASTGRASRVSLGESAVYRGLAEPVNWKDRLGVGYCFRRADFPT
jgi:hypothetical protein